MQTHEELRRRMRDCLLSQMDFSQEVSDEEMYDRIDRLISREAREQGISLAERKKLRSDIFSSIRRLDVLQELVDDPGVTDMSDQTPILQTR